MLEGKFPNALKNREFEDNTEYIAKQLLQHIYYIKRKERQELKQKGPLPKNFSSSSNNFNEKKTDLEHILSDMIQVPYQMEKL